MVLIQPLDSEHPEDGETVLVHIAEQTDPGTGSGFSLRQWWPERNDEGQQVGLTLRARLASGVDALKAENSESVTVLGRFATVLEEGGGG